MTRALRQGEPEGGFPTRRLARLFVWLGSSVIIFAVFMVGLNPIALAFQTSFIVRNDSGEELKIVPVGVRAVRGDYAQLPRSLLSRPLLPSGGGPIDLAAGAVVKIRYDWDDINFSDVAILDKHGDVRQYNVLADAATIPCCALPVATDITIPALATVPTATPEVAQAARRATFNRRVFLVYGLNVAGPAFLAIGLILGRRAVKAAKPKGGVERDLA
jgi:hypothetical protein